jgi:hypothetical protein
VEESKWVYEPTPELASWWETQATSHGFTGFQHIGYIEVAYESMNAVQLTITAVDGISPTPLTLPSTGGVYSKQWLRVSPNKARAYTYRAVGVPTGDIGLSEFRMFLPDFAIWAKQWGSEGPYQPCRILGSDLGDKARI